MKVWENTLSGSKTVHVFRNGRAACGSRAMASFSDIKRTAAEAESKGLNCCKRCSAKVTRNAVVKTNVGTVPADRTGRRVMEGRILANGDSAAGTVVQDLGNACVVQFDAGGRKVVPNGQMGL